MERPGAGLIGSLVVHGAIVGAVLLALSLGGERPRREVLTTIPVSILSEDIVLAGPADAPSEEPAADNAAAPPVEAVEPPPPTPEPAPVPTPRPPEKAPTPRPTPRPTPPPRPAAAPPPAKKAPTPRPPREESLDLGALAADRPNRSPNRGAAPPSGQRAAGTAGQTSGPVISSMFEQVYPNWNVFVVCDMEGGDDLRIQFDVTLSPDGRITDGPTLVGARGNSVQQAATAEAVRALRATAPFDVPRGFTGGRYRPTFLTARACSGR
ncbi:MAG: hypothetical protein SWI22_13765 [Pseudomonadota bacterium]|nr:hypothetical protein [Pseudomonadota bacterium]